MTRQCC